MNDLIDRTAAIYALKAKAVPLYKDPGCNDIWERDRTLDNAIDVIRGLPSVEPEIVLCKYCENFSPGKDEWGNCCENPMKMWRETDFCSWAERRTDAD